MPRRKPTQDTSANLKFPLQGIDLSTGFNAQRQGTTTNGQNVRAYDAGTLRARGGSRSGLTPFLGAGSTAQVNGFNLIQHLNSITTVDSNATFNPNVPPPPTQTMNAVLNYKEVVMGTPFVALPANNFDVWVTSGPTTFPAGSNPARGLRVGTCSFTATQDGTNVTLVATLVGLGDTYTGLTPGLVITSMMANNNFFPPGSSAFVGSWTAIGDSDGAIMTLSFSVSSF